MLKSCAYCGKIHPKGYVCPKKPKRKYGYKDRDRNSVKFRAKNAWKEKAVEIKERDNWCCVVCRAGIYDIGGSRINYKNLEVHHIEKLIENIDLGLVDDNLITLCAVHHRMADNGKIPKKVLKSLIKKQEEDDVYVY